MTVADDGSWPDIGSVPFAMTDPLCAPRERSGDRELFELEKELRGETPPTSWWSRSESGKPPQSGPDRQSQMDEPRMSHEAS